MTKYLVTLSLLVLAFFTITPAANAHTIPISSCYTAAKNAGPYQSAAWRAALSKCKKYRRDHAWNHTCGQSVQATIRCVFGSQGAKAVSVANCETGGTFNVRATNGQYWGLFQVSKQWRRDISGFAWNAKAQAIHAKRVLRAVRGNWSPTWSCA